MKLMDRGLPWLGLEDLATRMDQCSRIDLPDTDVAVSVKENYEMNLGPLDSRVGMAALRRSLLSRTGNRTNEDERRGSFPEDGKYHSILSRILTTWQGV